MVQLFRSILRPLHPLLAALIISTPVAATAQGWTDAPVLADKVKAGALPPIEQRLPRQPMVMPFPPGTEPGRHGGDLTWIGTGRDVRMMVVYGYSRLVIFDESLNLVPDILAAVEVQDDTVFTLKLRPGHRWSDGTPFTSEDFRYYWQDVALNKQLSPTGPPASLMVDGKPPQVEFPDATTVIYRWQAPNPTFLSDLAGAAPLYIYRPAHYLKQFHEAHAKPEALDAEVKKAKARNWAQLHNRKDNQYRNDNPDLPTLDPWVNRTPSPAERFVFERNPYFHRVDPAGRQLPYIDRVILQTASTSIIPVKTGAGETDLQARYLMFDNYAFLKQSAAQHKAEVYLWQTGRGAHLALYPNLTVADPVWRNLMRDVRFRRALSLGINRRELNQVVFYGLGLESINTVLPESPLYSEGRRLRWALYDPMEANRLLDEIGLKREGRTGPRTLPDGRPLTIVVESGSDGADQSDVLQLIKDHWADLGIRLLTKTMQSDVFRNRLFAGETVMSIGPGAENGLATAAMSPAEWAPTQQVQQQWSRWGNFTESNGKAGDAIDFEPAGALLSLYKQWRATTDTDIRTRIWTQMLDRHADEVLTIGLVAAVPQPVYAKQHLRNLPAKGMYNWEPGAHFGRYHPDRFWLDLPQKTVAKN